jgi:hypothetical protein
LTDLEVNCDRLVESSLKVDSIKSKMNENLSTFDVARPRARKLKTNTYRDGLSKLVEFLLKSFL